MAATEAAQSQEEALTFGVKFIGLRGGVEDGPGRRSLGAKSSTCCAKSLGPGIGARAMSRAGERHLARACGGFAEDGGWPTWRSTAGRGRILRKRTRHRPWGHRIYRRAGASFGIVREKLA